MDLVQAARQYKQENGIGEVPICGMDDNPVVLHGANGKSYIEVETNIWMELDGDCSVAYVGTSRHGGHMTLRPLFVNLDGTWLNSQTGRKSDLLANSEVLGSVFDFPIHADGQHESVRSVFQGDWHGRCEALVRIYEIYNWSSDPEGLYQHVYDSFAQLFRCDELYINFFSPDGVDLVGSVYRTDGRSRYRWEGPLGEGEAARYKWMLEMDEPVLVDLERDAHDAERLLSGMDIDANAKCVLAMPLRANGTPEGICLALFNNQLVLDEGSVAFLTLVGRALGMFVKRSRDSREAHELHVLDERKTVAKAIHENVSTLVGSLSLRIAAASSAMDSGDLSAARQDLEDLEVASRQVMRLIEDEIFSLDVALEQARGFVDGVAFCLEHFQESWGIQAELDATQAKTDRSIRLFTSLHLMRILNESLSNVLRHANATQVKVTLVDADWCFTMTVEDDGRGFDVAKAEAARTFGLQSMRKRAEAAGGQLSVFSDDSGTTVCVDIPYDKTKLGVSA